ncbi:hypothetical protein [Caballeronia telluris]|uniref:Uncharacterized protein n=1 Tax=Caballeronia telluris TaxID=326475 RepID=A0A158K6G9_9BURK|nr:hypothetical protein [Caballeronia telluris]SAL76585.1 hypothetical protein AWB66_05440 [Caballeronia telluris]
MTRIELAAQANFTRGTGAQTIDSKLVVDGVPVQPNTLLDFTHANGLAYQAFLYELRDKPTGNAVSVVPNWFGVAIPNPDSFDLSSDVYVVLYFHPTPGQAGYRDQDYPAKTGTSGGTDWKQLFAYVDRLGGQMVDAIRAGAPANRLTIFPFLTQAQYTLSTSEWFNVIHDILQDINSNIVNGICTRPKKLIVATLSNGSVYLNKFLTDAAADPNNGKIIEVWDFDSEISTPQILVDPHGKRLRAYWQGGVPASTTAKTYVQLPTSTSWSNFPGDLPTLQEVPPLPPLASNSNSAPDSTALLKVHHYIRDTMFVDAVFNIESDNP